MDLFIKPQVVPEYMRVTISVVLIPFSKQIKWSLFFFIVFWAFFFCPPPDIQNNDQCFLSFVPHRLEWRWNRRTKVTSFPKLKANSQVDPNSYVRWWQLSQVLLWCCRTFMLSASPTITRHPCWPNPLSAVIGWIETWYRNRKISILLLEVDVGRDFGQIWIPASER